jgi:hypothetical protein
MENKLPTLLQSNLDNDTVTALSILADSAGYIAVEEYLDNRIKYFTEKVLNDKEITLEKLSEYRARIASFTDVKVTINNFKSQRRN